MADSDIVAAIQELGKKIDKAGGDEGKGGKGRSIGRDTDKGLGDLQEELDLLTQYEAKLKKLGKSQTARFAQAEQARIIAAKKLEILQAELELKGEFDASDAKRLESAEKDLEVAERKLEKLEEATQAIKRNTAEMGRLGGAAADAVLPLEKSKFFNVDAMKNLWTVMNAGVGGMAAGLASFGIGIIENFIGGIIDAIFAIDEMETSMQRATGMSADMARQFSDASDSVSQYWISVEQFGEAVEGLYGTFSDFTMLGANMQNQLAATTSVLMEWGVSAETIGDTFQYATKMMGQTAAQANTTALEISSLAMNIGVPVDQMMQDFTTMMPQLAKLGPAASDSFREMARVSKITGLEVQKLLALTDKFDTFEGAATMAGQLNAALGGNFVNAMDMMTATDPVERFEMLRGSLEEAGLTFDDMSYYQRQFFAESMGLDSVGDLALMMSGNMSALGEETNRTARDYEEMAQAAAEQATLQEKFDGFLQDIMRTLVDGGLLDSIHDLFDQFSKGKGPLIEIKNGILNFVEEMKKLKPLFTWIIENWRQIVEGFIIFKGLQIAGTLAPIVRLFGGMAAKIWGLVTAKGAETAADVTSIGPRATVIGQKTAEANRTDNDTRAKEMNTAANYRNAPSVTAVGTASASTWPAILAMGVAMLFLGAGIGLAAYGLSFFVAAFEPFEADQIFAISLAILAFGAAMAFIAYVMISAAPAMLASTPAMYAMAFAFLAIGAAIALAAFGFSMFVDALAPLPPSQIAAISGAFLQFAFAIGLLSYALITMGNPLALIGLKVFAGVVAVITLSMISMIAAVGSILPALGEMFNMMGGADSSAFENLGAEMETISEAVEDMNLAKVLAVTAMIGVGASRSGAVRGGGGGAQASSSGWGSGRQKIEISLNETQTRDFLRGIVVEVDGESSASAVGSGN